MVWASTDILPTSVSTQVFYSEQGGTNVFDDWIVTLKNTNSSGQAFDFTAMTGATLRIDPAPNDKVASSPSLAIAATIVSASATGAVLKFAASDVKAGVSARGTRNLLAAITGTDGATTLFLASGSLSVQVTP